jgi:hypothetical protein
MKIDDYVNSKDELDPVQYFGFLASAVKDKLRVFILGKTHGKPIFLLIPKKFNKKLPNILFLAGMHGEELSGCWAILRFIEEYYDLYSDIANISFIPVANPIGFLNDMRNNKENINVNNFIGNNVAIESKILLKNLNITLKLSRNCFISLHEDTDEEHCYSYTFEKDKKPTKFSFTILNALKEFFTNASDITIKNKHKDLNGEPLTIHEGIVFKHYDGSLEDILFRKGILFTGVSETPGKFNIVIRIEAQINVMKKVIEFISGKKVLHNET